MPNGRLVGSNCYGPTDIFHGYVSLVAGRILTCRSYFVCLNH